MLVALGGCAVKHPTADLVDGKVLFVQDVRLLPHARPRQHERHDRPRTSTTLSARTCRRDHALIDPGADRLLDPLSQHPGRDATDAAQGPGRPGRGRLCGRVAARPGQDTGALALAGGVTGTTPAAGQKIFNGIGGCASCHTLAAPAPRDRRPHLDQELRPDCALPRIDPIRGATLAKCIYTAITDPYAYIPAGYTSGIMPVNFAHDAEPRPRSPRWSTSSRRRRIG